MTDYPAEQDFTVANNETWIRNFAAVDASSAVIDLTGKALHAQLRTSATDTNIALDLSSPGAGIIITSPADGHWQFYIGVSTTAQVKPGVYVYDVLLSDPTSPEVLRIQFGNITVVEGVTR